MILTIFRPKRTKDGKPHVSRSYRGRYRLEEGDKLTVVEKYKETLTKYPNPPAANVTKF